MSTPDSGKRIWAWAVVAAVVAAALVVVVFRAPRAVAHLTVPVLPGTRVVIESLTGAGADKLLGERAMLRNPTPLFLPTKWNASQQAGLGSVRRELESAFQDFPARLAFGDAAPSLAGFPPAVVAPEGPAARLAGAYDARPYAGLGRADREPAPLSDRGAFVEVTAERDGNRVLAEALAEARPPAAGVLWEPVEFVAAVDAAGLVGVPVLTRSSRLAAVDGYFQAYLVKTLRLGERLAPGFYRVCVGP